MPFTVRVVLHEHANSDATYTRLHAEMKARGFTRFIQGGSTWYHMPPAEYRYEGLSDVFTVHDSARAAGSATGHLKSIFVTENVGPPNVAFSGLDVAGPFELALG